MTMQPEVRLGRNFIRKGDPCNVKPNGKTQFKSGWTFLGYNAEKGYADVKDPRTGHTRSVTLDRIQRVAVTKGGKRKDEQ